jgi:hypothetical protein
MYVEKRFIPIMGKVLDGVSVQCQAVQVWQVGEPVDVGEVLDLVVVLESVLHINQFRP